MDKISVPPANRPDQPLVPSRRVPVILQPMAAATRYHVVNKIAHGGMAEIFLALQLGAENFQKTVVLKRILPSLAADPSFVRMLVDEAHIASRLNHSNLVQVLDLGMAGPQYFLVLEF